MIFRMLFRSPVLCITLAGVLISFLLQPIGIQYDSGGLRTLAFFAVQLMMLSVNISQDLLDFAYRPRNALHFSLSLILGIALSMCLDFIFRKLIHICYGKRF